MNIDFEPPKTWEAVNDQLRKSLGLLEDIQVRVYRGTFHAFYEVSTSLARLYTHKQSAAFVNNCGPYFEKVKIETSREGGQVQTIDFKSLGEAEKWANELGRETLFLAYALDDPLTGRVYNVEPLLKGLGEKKIFRISLSHSYHRYRQASLNVGAYEVRLLSAGPGYTLVLAGKKVQLGTYGAAGTMRWSIDEAEAVVEGLSKQSEEKEKILKFESKNWAESKSLFSDKEDRIFDRAAIYWEDMDGEAVIQLLAEKLGFKLDSPGVDRKLETGSLCRWGGLKSLDWLKGQGLSAETIRGLVFIDASLINDSLGPALESVHQEILKIQNG